MSVIQTSSVSADLRREAPRARNVLVAEAPESYTDGAGGNPARGMVVALAISAVIWAGIIALIF